MNAIHVTDARRILVLNRNHIGDCLLTTPLLRALKRGYPRAHITVSIPDSLRDLLVTNPHVDAILPRPDLNQWSEKFRFAFDIRGRDFDLIISLQEKSKFYAWATRYATLLRRGRPVTVALEHSRTRCHYQHHVSIRSDRHEVYKYLDIAEGLGCPVDRNPVLELATTQTARDRVDRLAAEQGFDADTRFIGLNPGATKDAKRWAAQRFAIVGERLSREFGLPVMVLGGPQDQERAELIAAGMGRRPLMSAGRAGLADTAALLERCAFLVTNDTGPMHMAVAMAVPVVALFGPTSPQKYGPFTRLKTVLRHEDPCPRCVEPCLHTITPDECIEAARKLYTAPPVRRVLQ